MSLINDALKRAKQVQVRQPSTVATDPALQPVVHVSTAWPWAKMMPLFAFIVLLLGVWCLWLWWGRTHSSKSSPPTVASLNPPHRATNGFVASFQKATNVLHALASNNLASEAEIKALSAPVNASPAPIVQAPALSEPLSNKTVSVISSGSRQTSGLAPAPAPVAVESAPPANVEPIALGMKLQGIFYRSSRASALIDGQSVFVGDEIDGAKIVAIERQQVRLVKGGRPAVLKLR